MGLDISIAPSFSDIQINGDSRTAIRIAVFVHRISAEETPLSEPGVSILNA